ncbi:MAG: NADH-quinone oxidoreductase subunit M [Gammaproteobacteria bacterium]|nr:NADH-quinone oxidoreductase subunit M [Gammaproteobacteria bacterium]
MPQSSAVFPFLSLMLLLLLAAAVMIWLFRDARQARWIALGATLLALLLSLVMLFGFSRDDYGFQFVEQMTWIPTLNINYLLGVDGISILFLPLTQILFFGVILASWTRIRFSPRLYFSLLLQLQLFTLGIFCALDTMLFFLFWELTLLPLYFLISLWGIGPSRRYAAVKYTLFMLAGGIPLLFGMLLLAFNHAVVSGTPVPLGLTFNYLELLQTAVPKDTQNLVFLLLLAGFAVKTPLIPLHTWLPEVAQEGPIAVVALLTGLKLGAYGLLRFVVPLAPEAALSFHWLLAGLGVIGILYGGVLALRQTNLRRMLAFSSISHIGLVLLGIASFRVEGTQGVLFQLLNFTIVAGGIFLLTGFLHHRIGSNDLLNLGGAARTMPLLAGFYLLFGLAGMGVPGTAGFPAEFLILTSAIATHTGAGLAALFGMVLGCAYFLSLYRRVFLGPVGDSVVAEAEDLRPREMVLALLLALLVLLFGLYPTAILELTEAASRAWMVRLTGAV